MIYIRRLGACRDTILAIATGSCQIFFELALNIGLQFLLQLQSLAR